MEKLFEVVTPYTYEAYKKLNKFYTKNKKNKIKVMLLVLSILIILCSIFLIVLKNYTAGMLYLVIGTFFLLWVYIAPNIISKIMEKSYKSIDTMVNTTAFYSQYFENINEQITTKVEYDEIYDAYETKEYLYIYVSKSSSYMILKSGMKLGNVEELSEFLKLKIKDKFKITK